MSLTSAPCCGLPHVCHIWKDQPAGVPAHVKEVQAIIDQLDHLVPLLRGKLMTPGETSDAFAQVRTALISLRDEPR